MDRCHDRERRQSFDSAMVSNLDFEGENGEVVLLVRRT